MTFRPKQKGKMICRQNNYLVLSGLVSEAKQKNENHKKTQTDSGNPEFKTEKEEADFWATHDTTEYDFEDTDETITLSGSLKAKLEARRRERLRKKNG